MTRDTAPITGGDGAKRNEPDIPVHTGEAVADRIAELVAEGDGFWRACTGCQESVDGYVSTTEYPFSRTFQCQPGGGCGECGGLGVIWDNIDYDEMARCLLADMDTEAAAPPPAAREGEDVLAALIEDELSEMGVDGLPYSVIAERLAAVIVDVRALSAPKATGGGGSFSQAKIPSQTEAGCSDNIQQGGGG